MFKASPALAATAAVVVAAALVVPTVSQAAESVSMRVSYADLNLTSAEGSQALQHRIAIAARVVCGYEESKLYDVVIATKACRSGAIEGARPAYEAALASARHGTVIVGEAAIVVSAGR
jgi:UrcA family protein